MRRKGKPEWQKKIAKERIKILFKKAEEVFNENPKIADRYIELARKIGMRYNVRIPRELKRKFCRKCYKYLRPNINCKVRTRKDKQSVVIKCLECGYIMRYPYKKEKKK